jgi:hypothetical protein
MERLRKPTPAVLVQEQVTLRRARGRSKWNLIQPPANPLEPVMVATTLWNGRTVHSQQESQFVSNLD